MFADDTNIFCSGDDLPGLIKTVGTILSQWFSNDRFSLNETITKFVLFSWARKECEIKLNLKGVKISAFKIKFSG